jgi:hypothetical protein
VGKRNDGAGKLVVLQGQGSSPGSVIFTSNVVHSPNAVSLDNTGLKGAVADGSKKVHGQAAFHMFSAPAQTGPFTIQSLKVTGETNHGIKISASGNAIVGGSDDKKLYYFPVP